MDVHPTPFSGNKAQPLKSKYKNTSEPPKHKIKHTAPPPQMHRRTFGTIRDTNVTNIPEKKALQKPKSKPSNPISLKHTKTESENKTPQRRTKKKAVSFTEKPEGSVTKKSPERGGEGVKTPVRPPFSVKPVRVPGTPYLSAEKCSSCRFDRLETSSYWLGQIKSSEAVGKHFVSVEFFRLAHECRAEPVRNLQNELKTYLTRHEYLRMKSEWEHVSRVFGILTNEHKTKSDDDGQETAVSSGSKLGDGEEHEG